MYITIDITTDELYELYSKNYKETQVIHKIINALKSQIPTIRDESDSMELLIDEFYSQPSVDDPELYMDEEGLDIEGK